MPPNIMVSLRPYFVLVTIPIMAATAPAKKRQEVKSCTGGGRSAGFGRGKGARLAETLSRSRGGRQGAHEGGGGAHYAHMPTCSIALLYLQKGPLSCSPMVSGKNICLKSGCSITPPVIPAGAGHL